MAFTMNLLESLFFEEWRDRGQFSVVSLGLSTVSPGLATDN
jgi:hypothetical protein